MNYKSKNKAFTVADVLIALVLIGVIASLRVPQVLNIMHKNEYRSALKKSISVTNNALLRHHALTNLTASDYTSADSLVEEVFKTQTNTINNINIFSSDDCLGSSFGTTDGILYCVQNFYSETSNPDRGKCNIFNTEPCTETDAANLWIDVNGYKKPNKATISAIKPSDIYQAQIYSQKVVPFGQPTIDVFYSNDKKPDDSDTIASNIPDNIQPPEPSDNDNNYWDDKNPDEITPDDIPDDPTDMWDPRRWPSFYDFLVWLWNLLHKIFFP